MCASNRYGRKEILELLLRHGADVHATANEGKSALMYAAHSNNSSMVDVLLHHGVEDNLNVADTAGTTALMYAAGIGDTNTMELLLQHGADPNAKDHHGKTAEMLKM